MMHTNTARYDLDHFDIIFRPSLHESDRRQKYPFTFDKVFNHEVSQQDVFTEISQLVQSALDGYKVNNTDNQSKSRPVKNDRVIHGDYSRKPPIAAKSRPQNLLPSNNNLSDFNPQQHKSPTTNKPNSNFVHHAKPMSVSTPQTKTSTNQAIL
ncbi:hypothetical protein JHK86_043696 [Glycine max]|nr:hypothetical protein JHK86_043696 [Glycine max]